MERCRCGERAEWADKYCQGCWERHCDNAWWDAVEGCIAEVERAWCGTAYAGVEIKPSAQEG